MAISLEPSSEADTKQITNHILLNAWINVYLNIRNEDKNNFPFHQNGRNLMLIYLCISYCCITNHPKPQCLPTLNIHYGSDTYESAQWSFWSCLGNLMPMQSAVGPEDGSADGCLSPMFGSWLVQGEKTGLIFLSFWISHHTLLGFSHDVGKDLRGNGSIQDILRSRLKTEVHYFCHC